MLRSFLWVWTLDACGAGPQVLAVASPRGQLTEETRLSLPPRGKVSSAQLANGEPVWVSRSADDVVWVVAGTARVSINGTVRYMPVRFDSRSNTFDSAAPFRWNVKGRVSVRAGDPIPDDIMIAVMGPFDSASVSDLDTYEVSRVDVNTIAVHERRPATHIEPPLHQSSLPWVRPEPGDRSCAHVEPLSVGGATAPDALLRRALSLPTDRVVLLDADLVLAPGEAARICPRASLSDPDAPCPEGSPRLYDVDGAEPGRNARRQPGPFLLRRTRDGFSELTPWRDCADLDQQRVCGQPRRPLNDESWLTTPVGDEKGLWIDSPVACETRAPGVRMIRVHGHGQRRLAGPNASEVSSRCATPDAIPADCPWVPRAPLESTLLALSHQPEIQGGFGVAGCFATSGATSDDLALTVYDWGRADAAVKAVAAELDRWNLADTFWVSVESMFCIVPG